MDIVLYYILEMRSCAEHVKVHLHFTSMEAVLVILDLVMLQYDLSITNRLCELPNFSV